MPPRRSAPETTTAAAVAPATPPDDSPGDLRPVLDQQTDDGAGHAGEHDCGHAAVAVPASNPAKRTPTAVPSPSASPIVYQSPIVPGVVAFDGLFSGHTTLVRFDAHCGREST